MDKESSSSDHGLPRITYDIRENVRPDVAARLDALVQRYQDRIARQSEALTRLVSEKHADADTIKALREKVRELQSELDAYKRNAQGRGSW